MNLKHLLLYSKGWYKKYHPASKRKTIWDDLKIILSLDGYPDNVSKNDIFNIIKGKNK